MTVKLGSNIASLSAQRRLTESSSALSGAYERLSSGLRINKASDDPAGLALATSLKSDSRVFTQAIRNVNDGISLLSIAEGALKELSGIATRQLELAEQAANGSYSLEQRLSLNSEANALVEEFNRIVESTEFNDINLLDNSINELRVQAGYGVNGSIAFDIAGELARTIGNGTFQTSVSYTIGGTSYYNDAGDLNNDGNLDLVTTSLADDELSILLGNGDGTFQAAQVVGNGANYEVKIGDLDGDGNQDIVAADNGNSALTVFMGNGNGTFDTGVSYAIGLFPFSVELADLNNDGTLDLVASNPGDNNISVLIGNGNGTFQASVSYDAGVGVNNVTTGDFNGDGNLDIVSADYFDDGVSIFFGSGTGTFAARVTIAAGDGTIDVEAADFNGDGYLDMVTANHDDSSLSIILGNGDGTFQTAFSIAATGTPTDLSLDDFNGDGYTDILTGSDSGGAVSITYGNGDGTFQAAQSFTSINSPYGVISGDFNNDGAIDFAANRLSGSSIAVSLANTTQVTTIAYLNLNTANDAREALVTINANLNRVTQELGAIGATQSRLGVAVENLSASRENFYAAAGRIEDADVASEAANMIRLTVLQQASAAVLAQANQQPALALKLLEED